jgi:hypothetical protein
MVDMGTIASAVGSLNAAAQIAKGLLSLHDMQAVQSKVIELQGVILAAQSSALAAQSDQFTLLERVRELETKMAQLEAWETEKKRYALKDFGGNTFAYELKHEEARGEPMHRICPKCYAKGHKSILQSHGKNAVEQDLYQCTECKTEYGFGPPIYRDLSMERDSYCP